jgi:hypothetical protein
MGTTAASSRQTAASRCRPVQADGLIRNHAPLALPWDPKTGSRAAGVCES